MFIISQLFDVQHIPYSSYLWSLFFFFNWQVDEKKFSYLFGSRFWNLFLAYWANFWICCHRAWNSLCNVFLSQFFNISSKVVWAFQKSIFFSGFLRLNFYLISPHYSARHRSRQTWKYRLRHGGLTSDNRQSAKRIYKHDEYDSII